MMVIWRVFFLCLMMTPTLLAGNDSCAKLEGIQKLACEKSYHKLAKRKERSQRAASADVLIDSDLKMSAKESQAGKKSSKVTKRQNKSSRNRKKTASSSVSKISTRKNGSRYSDDKRDKSQSSKAAGMVKASNDQIKTESTQGSQVSHAALLDTSHATNEFDTVNVPKVNSENMMSSQLAYVGDQGIGDDALYQIY